MHDGMLIHWLRTAHGKLCPALISQASDGFDYSASFTGTCKGGRLEPAKKDGTPGTLEMFLAIWLEVLAQWWWSGERPRVMKRCRFF